jgi:hypothetical protein
MYWSRICLILSCHYQAGVRYSYICRQRAAEPPCQSMSMVTKPMLGIALQEAVLRGPKPWASNSLTGAKVHPR